MKKTMWPAVFGFLSLTAALTAGSARAGDTNYTGGEWSLVDTHPVLAAAGQITPDKYPNCDTVIVDGRMLREFRPDGTGACQDEMFTKVLTEKGRRDSRELSFSFQLPYSVTEVTKLEVIKPDGTVVPVDAAANSKVSIDEGQMDMNIYDQNSKVLQVNIPQLDIGDIVHVVSRQTINRSILPSEYDEENVFEGTEHIRHLAYEVHAPASLPLQRTVLRDEIAGTVSGTTQTNGDAVVYHWEVNNVPRMFDEPDMPPYEMVLQRLMVSTVPDWRDISKWYWNLSKPHLDMTTPEMTNTVASLTAGAKTDLDKVQALFFYVSKNIRYMGITPEINRPGFEPHDVCITFGKKYGVCRDKAGLLVEMLRLAGFNAYPVLINVGARLDQEVPEPDFNHAIVCVELTPGNYTLMDPTDENTRDLLPAYDQNRSYLVCRPEGETLRVSPVQSPDKNMLQVSTTGTLDANGVLTATAEMSFTGVNDDAYRNHLAPMRPDEQKRFFEGRLKEAIPGAKVTSLKLTPENMLDISQPLRAELTFTAGGMTANGRDKALVSLPWMAKDFGVANRLLIGAVGLEKRKYPLNTELTCGVREEMSLRLAGGFGAARSVPEFSPVNSDAVTYDEQATVASNTLVCSRELKLKTVEFSPAQYLQLKQTLKEMDEDQRKDVILALNSTPAEAATASKGPAEPPVDSNAEILHIHKSLAVKDAHTAVYHVEYAKHILTYDGKIHESEVKIAYNPACEEAKIIRGTVTSKTGARQEIIPDEINVMDESWNASAKRYPGGKILVASLPGVDIGSTIEVEFEITKHDLPYVSGFETFQFPDALDRKSFDLTAPAGLPVQTCISGTPGIVQEQDRLAGGVHKQTWEAHHVKALPSEEQLPPMWNYLAGVDYFVGDAGTYWKALNAAMQAHAQQSTQAAALARRLTASARTKLDAIRAIRDYIAQNIRAAGPGFTNLPLNELSAADTTLADGYGHAADRAILFSAMLSAAGFSPEFVIASTLPPVPGIKNVADSFPLPEDFQTPLVRVKVAGQDYYLNDGDQYAHLGATASDDKLGLVLSSGKLETIQAAPGCGNKTETDLVLSLTADGKAHIKIAKYYYGQQYGQTNRYFAELPPEERKQYFQEAVSGVAQGARAASDLKTDFSTYPGVEEFSVDLDDYGVATGNYLYFNLPFTPSQFATATDRRALPMYMPGKSERIVRAEVDLPAGYRETDVAPKSGHFAAPGGSQTRITKTSAAGKCTITYDFTTRPAVISPADYPKLVNIQSALGQKSGTTFLLERE